MTVKQLRAFLAVAQSLSFAQACERLHLSQPALSLAIKNLEQSLGGQLLVRTTRSVALTPEGETLLPIAVRLLADWDNAEDLLHQHFTLQMGKVAVAAMPSFAGNRLPAALRAFRDAYPRVNVTVHDVINEQVMEMVRDGRVELGIAFEPATLDGLQFTPLYEDRFVAVVPVASKLAEQPALTWAQLLEQPFITLQRPSAVRLLLEDSVISSHGKLPVAFESSVGDGRAHGRRRPRRQRRAATVPAADGRTGRPLPTAERATGVASRRPAAPGWASAIQRGAGVE